jgi:hypothetical protein
MYFIRNLVKIQGFNNEKALFAFSSEYDVYPRGILLSNTLFVKVVTQSLLSSVPSSSAQAFQYQYQ